MARRRRNGRISDRSVNNKKFSFDEMEQDEYRYRRSHRIRSAGQSLAAFCVFCGAIIAGLALFRSVVVKKNAPSTAQKDLTEWFEVSGNEVKVILNDRSETGIRGIRTEKEAYLPLDWIIESVDRRCFWNEEEFSVTYTTAKVICRFDKGSVTATGEPVLIDKNGKGYMAVSALKQLSNVTVLDFTSKEETAARVLIYTADAGEIKRSAVLRNTFLRTGGSIKSDVLTSLSPGDEVNVLDRYENWSRVSSAKGFLGYIENSAITEAVSFRFPDTHPDQVPERNRLNQKVVMGWHLMLGTDGNRKFDELYKNTGGAINVICPTWFQLYTSDGRYRNYASKEYVKKAHEKGLKVWAMVDNFNDPAAVRSFRSKEYFSSAANRADLSDRLIREAQDYGFDGFNLDFEGLPSDAGRAYVQFIREFSIACRERGLTLSVDNYVPYSFNDFYDLEEQGFYADYVVIMGYDEHTEASKEAGSVSSIGYTTYGIDETLKKTEAEGVINGIPFYTRIWTESGASVTSKTLSMKEAAGETVSSGYTMTWDEETGQFYGELKKTSEKRRVWLEDSSSLEKKMDVIRSRNLAGVACWRLGYEPADIWKTIRFDAEESDKSK